MVRKSKEEYGRAGQEQSLEDLLGKKGADEKGGVQGKQHRSRDWKICWIRLGGDGKEQYRESRTGAWNICGNRMRRWKGRVQGEQDRSRDWKTC
jgi:hypothetical protein